MKYRIDYIIRKDKICYSLLQLNTLCVNILPTHSMYIFLAVQPIDPVSSNVTIDNVI